MSGCIVQVWFEAERESVDRPARWVMIETELEDFATFCEMVEADRVIGGAILWTLPGERGEKIIRDRVPCAFRGSAVLRCQLPTWRFVEIDDAR